MVLPGVLDLPWWGVVIVALVLTHITIASVTIFLHRCQAHRALDLHPAIAHFFRFWLWMTTGMLTKEWAAIHRKHHAKCESPEDPHSPQQLGINRVLWAGVLLYVKESHNKETLERYGHGTPDDWIEKKLYTAHPMLGLILMALIDLIVLGIVPGILVFLTQIVWIPFWAAGVINGIGHFWGYRNWEADDASRNIFPWGILIGGEELHNNHHAFASSAKLSSKWYEFDIGWMYIRILSMLGMAQVKKVAPTPKFEPAKSTIDFDTLHAVITHRYDVLAKYAKSLRSTYSQELGKLKRYAPHDVHVFQRIKKWLMRDERQLAEPEREKLAEVLSRNHALETVYSMRRELAAVWERSTVSREQLLKQLQDWCHRAEASGIAPLREFSLRLRCYA